MKAVGKLADENVPRTWYSIEPATQRLVRESVNIQAKQHHGDRIMVPYSSDSSIWQPVNSFGAVTVEVAVEEGWVSASVCDALGWSSAWTSPNKDKLQRTVLVVASRRRTIMSEKGDDKFLKPGCASSGCACAWLRSSSQKPRCLSSRGIKYA